MLQYIGNFLKKATLAKYNNTINKADSFFEQDSKASNEELKEVLLSLKSEDFNDYSRAISIIKELSLRYLGQTPYNTQLKGALVLNDGMIAEMKTGEGKTLSAVVSIVLNYLQEKNIHIVTANEYLVKRDYEFSKPLFDFLGITSGFIDSQDDKEKKAIYDLDVVYSTSKGFVFDYLNNNKFFNQEMLFNERRDFVIVDEVDFVLIDEARTPIILSGMLETDKASYTFFEEMQKKFVGAYKGRTDGHDDPDFFYNDRMVELTDKGFKLAEKILFESKLIESPKFLYHGAGFKLLRSLETALKANYLFEKDVAYLVIDEEVVIINQQTGRPQKGRRFSDGLHQAIEAKEVLSINNDAQSLAQTTLQNYFKKYKKIAGMTGTATTEEIEFREFYFLKVLQIETNKPLVRIDSDDLLFLSKEAMLKSFILDLKNNIKEGRPTLIGTQSVAESEVLSKILKSNNISFESLDAKNHEREAFVIEQAGKKSAVTLATNMAGRGTDIMLGGNKEVECNIFLEKNPNSTMEEAVTFWQEKHDEIVEAGGLSVMGVGRSSSRRLDNQLIGRAGRQGDAGMTKFYLSLDDDIFANISKSMFASNWNKSNKDVGITSSIITKMVKESQKASESVGFSMRKDLLRFDNINTEQREIFYGWRRKVLLSKDLKKLKEGFFSDVINSIIKNNIVAEDFLSNDFDLMEKDFEKNLALKINIKDVFLKEKMADEDDLAEFIYKILMDNYNEKIKVLDENEFHTIEKDLLLKTMDKNWADNISGLEEMRVNTGLRSYAQKNPLDEYQKEALEMFSNLVLDVKKDYCLVLIRFPPLALLESKEKERKMQEELNKSQEEQVVKNVNVDYGSIDFIPNRIKGIGI